MTLRAKMALERQLCAAVRQHVAGAKHHVPEAGTALWRAFMSLSQGRAFGAYGPNPISFAEIAAWCALVRVPLAPHHVAIVRAMDAAWIDAFYSRAAAAKTAQKTLAPVSKQPLTAALFDIAVQ